MQTETKICTKCQVPKPTTEFHVVKNKWGSKEPKFSSHCKTCTGKAQKEYYQKTKFTRKDRNNEIRLKTRYNLSLAELNSMFVNQNGVCKICGTSLDLTSTRGFAVDHSHTTGQVRGLLCMTCNGGIGLLKDSVEILENAILYLRQYEEVNNSIVTK